MKNVWKLLFAGLVVALLSGCAVIKEVFTPVSYEKPPLHEGLSFSSYVGGYKTLSNTFHYNGKLISGGVAIKIGKLYVWSDDTGAMAILSHDNIHKTIYLAIGSPPFYGIGCGYSINTYSYVYPPCEKIGVTFDPARGEITFRETRVTRYLTTAILLAYSDEKFGMAPVTVSGVLTFERF